MAAKSPLRINTALNQQSADGNCSFAKFVTRNSQQFYQSLDCCSVVVPNGDAEGKGSSIYCKTVRLNCHKAITHPIYNFRHWVRVELFGQSVIQCRVQVHTEEQWNFNSPPNPLKVKCRKVINGFTSHFVLRLLKSYFRIWPSLLLGADPIVAFHVCPFQNMTWYARPLLVHGMDPFPGCTGVCCFSTSFLGSQIDVKWDGRPRKDHRTPIISISHPKGQVTGHSRGKG